MHKSKNAKKIESKKETKRLAHRHQFEQHVAVFLWENTHGGNYPRTRAIGAQGGQAQELLVPKAEQCWRKVGYPIACPRAARESWIAKVQGTYS